MGVHAFCFSTCGTLLALVAPIRWLTSAAAVLGVVSMVMIVEAISCGCVYIFLYNILVCCYIVPSPYSAPLDEVCGQISH